MARFTHGAIGYARCLLLEPFQASRWRVLVWSRLGERAVVRIRKHCIAQLKAETRDCVTTHTDIAGSPPGDIVRGFPSVDTGPVDKGKPTERWGRKASGLRATA